MQISADIPEEKAVWLNKRRKVRKAYLVFILLVAPLFATFFYLDERDYQQWLQVAAQYQQDCSHATATSPNCQLLPMQVYEHREEGFTDPDDDAHLWLGLQSKSGQQFMVDTYGPQWHRLGIGSSVTATVWNGEVEEVRDSGGSEMMTTNPVLKAQDSHLFLTGMKVFVVIWLCITLLPFISPEKQDEKEWKCQARNNSDG